MTDDEKRAYLVSALRAGVGDASVPTMWNQWGNAGQIAVRPSLPVGNVGGGIPIGRTPPIVPVGLNRGLIGGAGVMAADVAAER